MSVEEKVSWIEKGLDKNTSSIDSLSEKMTTIETYFKVVFAIAAVLGVSGALLFSELSAVSDEIAQYKDDAGSIEVQLKKLRAEAVAIKKDIDEAKNKALSELDVTGEAKKDELAKIISSVTPSQLASGLLKGSIKDLLVRNCGDRSCACPDGWSRAKRRDGNGDLNQGAQGDFIYICVQYH